jgi:hypothetical protein
VRATPTICRGTARGHELSSDEPGWIEPPGDGRDAAPPPVGYAVLAPAVCQLEVLDQALRAAHVDEYDSSVEGVLDGVTTESPDVDEPAGEMRGHHGGRMSHLTLESNLEVPEGYEGARRVLDVYDTGCVVGQSDQGGTDYTPEASLSVGG